MIENLKNRIQEEYNNFVEEDAACDLSDSELVENFWSNAIVEFNEENPEINATFEIINGIVNVIIISK